MMTAAHADPITPGQIEHVIDEVWSNGQLEQRYSFLDYHFEQPDAYFRARAYLDDIDVITIFGPFQRRGSITKVEALEAGNAVFSYCQHRFRTVHYGSSVGA